MKGKNLRTKGILAVYLIVAVWMAGVLIYIGFHENAEVVQTREDREYSQVKTYQCIEKEDVNTPIGVKKEYHWTLEEVAPGDTCLAFYVVHQYVQVYLEEELLYSLTLQEGKHIGKTTGSDWVMIPLYAEDAGKEIRIEVTPVYKSFKNREIEFLVGSEMKIYLERMKADLPQMVVSFLAITVGLLYIIVAIYTWIKKKYDNNLAALGTFSVMMGLWRVTDTRFSPFLLPNHPALLFYISLAMLMLGAIPLIRFIQYRVESHKQNIFNYCCLLEALVCLFQIVLQIFGIADFRESLFITHISLLVSAMIVMITICYEWFCNRREQKVRGSKGLFLMCVVGVVLDVFAFYIKGNSSGLIFTLIAFLVYTVITGAVTIQGYMNQERKLKEQEEELASNRIVIMLSQIQPHFLYNSLNAIYYLCKKDPEAARQAISDFSDYLRGNLDSLKRTAPVPFETELKHVKVYLSLEKMRFDEELNIVYDIETTAFLLPALTVQPLVENAVKHGVGKAAGGGTVKIMTRECKNYFEVTVCDNGVGYEPKEQREDGRTHIGIENVKNRLWKMSHATLEISGEKGKGTVAVIKLPKEENRENYSSR